MSQLWNRDGEVVAWTDHDGPGRPGRGASHRWFGGLAAGWLAWFSVALVGCAVFHERTAAHLDAPAWMDVLGISTVLLVPFTIGLLARERTSGLWLSAAVGVAACTYSATQVAVLPVWTVIEAAGFLALGVVSLWVATRRPVSNPTTIGTAPVAVPAAEERVAEPVR
jgi:hypothetical protein